MRRTKEKLFRLYAAPCPPDGVFYIPDCMGEYSPFLDPQHDSFGQELVTCFLVDPEGHIGMFLNRKPCGYVPYNLLFHVDEYNRFLKHYFPQDEADAMYTQAFGSPKSLQEQEQAYRRQLPVWEYINGELSLRGANPISFFVELCRIVQALHTLRYDKELRATKLRAWKTLKRYYQRKGLYVFAPSPDYTRLIRIFAPNRLPRKAITEEVAVFAQKVPLDFSATRSIAFSTLRQMWQQG